MIEFPKYNIRSFVFSEDSHLGCVVVTSISRHNGRYWCIFDQPFQQQRWRVTVVLAKFVEDELGVQSEGRRPAFQREDDLIVHLLSDQIADHNLPRVTATPRTAECRQHASCSSRTRPVRNASLTHGTTVPAHRHRQIVARSVGRNPILGRFVRYRRLSSASSECSV